MEIRLLEKKDLASLLELYVQLDEKNKELNVENVKDIWEKIEKAENIFYIGALDGEKVVSTCYLAIIPNLTYGKPIGFIENVVTDENYCKRGLGKSVINYALQIAKEHNCYKAILQSSSYRIQAHEFYKNLGFSDTTKKAFDYRFQNIFS